MCPSARKGCCDARRLTVSRRARQVSAMRLIPSLALMAGCLGLALAAAAQPKPPPLDAAPAPSPPGGKPGLGNGLMTGLPTVKPPPLPPGSDPFAGGGGTTRRAVSSGTGFVVAPGRLLTNSHVADGFGELRACTSCSTVGPA